MLSRYQLVEMLKVCRLQGFICKGTKEDQYTESQTYDWKFVKKIGSFTYVDCLMGMNPYSGLERIFEEGCIVPMWYCDYLGHIDPYGSADEAYVITLLKRCRKKGIEENGSAFFLDYAFTEGEYEYKSRFSGDLQTIIQTEIITYKGIAVGRQISSGGLQSNERLLKEKTSKFEGGIVDYKADKMDEL